MNNCVDCGRECEPTEFSLGPAARPPNYCKECWYWKGQLEHKPEERVVYKGEHYRARPALPLGYPASIAGHGGAQWRIIYNDGSHRICNNLWHQGPIPERWRDRLPDNCTTLQELRKGEPPL